MKRYQFRLATVLRVRRIEEEAARAHMLEARTVAVRARVARDQAAAHCRDLPVALGPSSADEFRKERQVLELAAASLSTRQAALLAAEGEAERVRALWSAAAARVAVLERLDERRREEHRLAVDGEEIRFLDEVASRQREDVGA